MITRRIHIIDGLPLSSNEVNNLIDWLNVLTEELSSESNRELNIHYPDIQTISTW